MGRMKGPGLVLRSASMATRADSITCWGRNARGNRRRTVKSRKLKVEGLEVGQARTAACSAIRDAHTAPQIEIGGAWEREEIVSKRNGGSRRHLPGWRFAAE